MGEEARKSSRLIGEIYRLGQVITSGGMLTTYTAYNRNTNDVVGLLVIKLLPEMDIQVVQHLLQPLEKRRSLHSPHVIGVYDWGIDDAHVYIATDAPRGITLRHVLDSENISISQALDFLQQMARGLKALHEHGIVGIDLRPQLITVDSVAAADRVQLDDVGMRALLKELGYISSQQIDDIGFLDPRYAPPEYISGKGLVGPWSDTYQLGLLLFELVTGRLPYVGKNAAETGVLQSTSPIPRMAQYKHEAPAVLQEVLERALAKNPQARFADAAHMLASLEAIQLPRSARSGEWHGGGQAATGVTGEMPHVDSDIALRATLISSTSTVSAGRNDAGQTLPEGDGVYAYLCCEKDGAEIQRFAIVKKNVIVGRKDPKRGLTPDIDLTAIDQKMTVSRQHARIRYEETFFYIEDLKSRNKTRLGEVALVPLKPELLRHGDIVYCGNVRLVFRVPGMRDTPL